MGLNARLAQGRGVPGDFVNRAGGKPAQQDVVQVEAPDQHVRIGIERRGKRGRLIHHAVHIKGHGPAGARGDKVLVDIGRDVPTPEIVVLFNCKPRVPKLSS
jgi:hypothetical protein